MPCLGIRMRSHVLRGNLIFFFLRSNRGDSLGHSTADPEEMGDAGHSTGKRSPCALPAPPADRETRLSSPPQSPKDAEVFPKATGSGSRDSGVIQVVQKNRVREVQQMLPTKEVSC